MKVYIPKTHCRSPDGRLACRADMNVRDNIVGVPCLEVTCLDCIKEMPKDLLLGLLADGTDQVKLLNEGMARILRVLI